MSSAIAVNSLRALEGEDLLKVGRRVGIIARGQERLDKGWATRVVRAALGRDVAADVDIRTIPLRTSTGAPKHALALAAIDFDTIVATPFARSDLRAALEDVVLVAREDERDSGYRRRSRILGVSRFSLTDSGFLAREVERDYETIRRAVARGEQLNGSMGRLIQARTKGRGGEDTERTYAFYVRSSFLSRMLGLI